MSAIRQRPLALARKATGRAECFFGRLRSDHAVVERFKSGKSLRLLRLKVKVPLEACGPKSVKQFIKNP